MVDEPLPRADRDAMAPSDWAGSDALRTMLEDVRFPLTARELRERAGSWRVPVRGSEETVALARLLDGFDDDRSFRSADDVAKAVRRDAGWA